MGCEGAAAVQRRGVGDGDSGDGGNVGGWEVGEEERAGPYTSEGGEGKGDLTLGGSPRLLHRPPLLTHLFSPDGPAPNQA